MIRIPPIYIENALVSRPVGFSTGVRLNYIDNTMKFPEKLWLILENENVAIASWSQDGTQFYLSTSPEFINIILPRYFKHNKLSSFERQLNLYGFKRQKRQQFDVGTYYHPYFQRSRKDLLSCITRVIKKYNHEEFCEIDSVRGNDCKSIISGVTSNMSELSPRIGHCHNQTLQDYVSINVDSIRDIQSLNDCDLSVTSTAVNNNVTGSSTIPMKSQVSIGHCTDATDSSTFDTYDDYALDNSVQITDDFDFSILLDLVEPDTNNSTMKNNVTTSVLEALSESPKPCNDSSESTIASQNSSNMHSSHMDIRLKFSYDFSMFANKYNIPYHVWKQSEEEMLSASQLISTSSSNMSMTTVESSNMSSLRSFNTTETVNNSEDSNQYNRDRVPYTCNQLPLLLLPQQTMKKDDILKHADSSIRKKTNKRKLTFNMNHVQYPHPSSSQNHTYCGMNGYSHRPPPIQIPTTLLTTSTQLTHDGLINPIETCPIMINNDSLPPISPMTPMSPKHRTLE